MRYEDTTETVPLKEHAEFCFQLTQHIGNGSFEIDDDTIEMNLSSGMNGTVIVTIGNADGKDYPRHVYTVTVDDILQAAIRHYKAIGRTKPDYYSDAMRPKQDGVNTGT